MSRIMLEFECPSHGVFEAFTDSKDTLKSCPDCDTVSPRIISTPRIKLEGITGAFPTAYDAWTRMHERGEVQARERRMKDEGPDA